MSKKKIKVTVELEVDVFEGLERIACTTKGIIKYEVENGLEISKILSVSSDDINVDEFYECGDDYLKGKSHKSEEDYRKSFED